MLQGRSIHVSNIVRSEKVNWMTPKWHCKVGQQYANITLYHSTVYITLQCLVFQINQDFWSNYCTIVNSKCFLKTILKIKDLKSKERNRHPNFYMDTRNLPKGLSAEVSVGAPFFCKSTEWPQYYLAQCEWNMVWNMCIHGSIASMSPKS